MKLCAHIQAVLGSFCNLVLGALQLSTHWLWKLWLKMKWKLTTGYFPHQLIYFALCWFFFFAWMKNSRRKESSCLFLKIERAFMTPASRHLFWQIVFSHLNNERMGKIKQMVEFLYSIFHIFLWVLLKYCV